MRGPFPPAFPRGEGLRLTRRSVLALAAAWPFYRPARVHAQGYAKWPKLAKGFDPFDTPPDYFTRLLERRFNFANVDMAVMQFPYYDKPINGHNVPAMLRAANPNVLLGIYWPMGPQRADYVESHPDCWLRNAQGQPFTMTDQNGTQHYADGRNAGFQTFVVNLLNRYVTRHNLAGFHYDNATYPPSYLEGWAAGGQPTTQTDKDNAIAAEKAFASALRQRVANVTPIGRWPPYGIFEVESEGQNWGDFHINQANRDAFWNYFTTFDAVYFAGYTSKNAQRAEYLRNTFAKMHAMGGNVHLTDDNASTPKHLTRWLYCFYLCFSNGLDYFDTDPLPDEVFLNPPETTGSRVRYLIPQSPAVNTGGMTWQRTFDKAAVVCDLSGTGDCSYRLR